MARVGFTQLGHGAPFFPKAKVLIRISQGSLGSPCWQSPIQNKKSRAGDRECVLSGASMPWGDTGGLGRASLQLSGQMPFNPNMLIRAAAAMRQETAMK